MRNSRSHRQQVGTKSRLGTKLFLGLCGAHIASKENTCLIKSVPHFRLWFDPFPILSLQPAGEAQYQFQNLRTQNTRAPCHRRQQNRALSPGKARWFLWDCVGASGREETSAELSVRTQSSCPIFHNTAPVAHGGVSLFPWADFEMFRLQSGNVYELLKMHFAGDRKAQTKEYIQHVPRMKRVGGKNKDNVSDQICQPESFTSNLNTSEENPKSYSSLKC